MNQPKSLKELVDLAIQFRGASGLGLSQLAAKNGLQITTTTINAIRQGTYKSTPREGTLRALAWLAGVDASVAFTAAGQPVPGPPFAEELPPGVDNLPPKARKAAIDMLRVLVDLNRDADEWKQAHEKERRSRVLREAGFVSPGQKTESVPDYLPVQSGAGDAQISIVIRELVRTYGSEDGRLPEDWRESIIESGVWEEAAAPFLKEHPSLVLKEQFQKRIVEGLEKSLANIALADAKRQTATNIEKIKARTRRADDHPDNDIPLPEHYADLAAHPATDSSGRREHEAGRERGEESQETEL